MNKSFKTPSNPNQLNPPHGRRIKVAVLMGGPGREREVSMVSGKCVADALKEAGVNVILADIKPDPSRLGVEPRQAGLDILDDETIDVFFITIHGTFGEDGQLQQILESKGLVYTGSDSRASCLAFDKWESKKLFKSVGILTPQDVLFKPGTKDVELENQISRIGPPSTRALVGRGRQKYVIKPLREGSTIGISISDNPKDALAAAKKCAAEFGDCMIEQFIAGKELTVSVLGNLALPLLEIRAPEGFYDYHAKYIGNSTEYLFDTIDDPALVADIQKSAVDCFNVLGCRGAARVDSILAEDGKSYVLEINTIPGMTEHSLLPKAAAKAGIPMSQLCLRIVEMAMADAGAAKRASSNKQKERV